MTTVHRQDGEHVSLVIEFNAEADWLYERFSASVLTRDAEYHGGTPEWTLTSADYETLLADATEAFHNYEGILS